MMEKGKLRKADIFSGSIICLVGLWIVSQALQMPMKDSWGGVQNVWFVSPAIFPLFVGGTITVLGAMLIRTAIKAVGWSELGRVMRWLGSTHLIDFMKTAAMMRFYAMVVLFLTYVYLMIPRVDFFLCSVIFLLVFIGGFYLDDRTVLQKLFFFYLAGSLIVLVFFASGIPAVVEASLPYAGDWLMILFIVATVSYTMHITRGQTELRRKYRLCITLALAAPFIVGAAFKYLLLVPMPMEGLVVAALDAIWYWDF